MNDYSSLFTSGLMLLCESTNTHSRHTVSEMSLDNTKNTASGLRSFLSLEMADSLRTFATSPASNSSSRAHSRKPSSERRARAGHSPAASPSKPTANAHKAPLSPASSRRRSLPQPKPAPLAELPVVPAAHTHGRSRSDSDASQALPRLPLYQLPNQTLPYSSSDCKGKARRPQGSSGSVYPQTRAILCADHSLQPISHHSPILARNLHVLSFDTIQCRHTFVSDECSISPDFWSIYAATLSPTTESALGLHHLGAPAAGPENIAPCNPPVVLKRARVRRNRHSAPSRNASVTANSMRSSQMSASTSYRRTQRSGALAQLEGRIPRSEWMSDDEEGASLN
ncbi:hypothetical protein RhiXN_05124 [Rhizoctonia solani]|uniref:Uncharacterized protein n=1 Tax=Rhizoctonia solani TaxID=456999 RepID=A0A8H8NQX3_9AGAM|nr:uncharacterized protein RhiXN_05124 [Rhizoctonia solani]QRW17122.1 hypothetical protein RhiXN_05124 [Rhizoctonia solani]